MVDGKVTRPAAQKDENSRLALMWANNLVGLLAGWAIDHQIGLVLSDPPGGDETPRFGSYPSAHGDDHIHEATGSQHEFDDSKINRRILTALLQYGLGPFPTQIVIEATDALVALDMGETQALVAPRRGLPGQGTWDYTKWMLRYEAVLHVEYFRGMGQKRDGVDSALGKVAEAYGVEPGTIDRWASEVPKKLKGISLVYEKGFARHAGEITYKLKFQDSLSDHDKRNLESLSRRWGDNALARHGSEFQQIPQNKGSVVHLPS